MNWTTWLPRRHPRGVPRPAPARALHGRGRGDRRCPDRAQRDAVLAAIKAWAGNAGAWWPRHSDAQP